MQYINEIGLISSTYQYEEMVPGVIRLLWHVYNYQVVLLNISKIINGKKLDTPVHKDIIPRGIFSLLGAQVGPTPGLSNRSCGVEKRVLRGRWWRPITTFPFTDGGRVGIYIRCKYLSQSNMWNFAVSW